MTWKLILEYNGTNYSGWQEQNNARTVQGQLRQAAQDFFETDLDIQGSGRTDAGVHARGQVAHLRIRSKDGTKRSFPPVNSILRSLNERLPSDICILEVTEAPDTFHARHDAASRSYTYQISTRRTAFFKKYVWWVREPLDVAAMSRAAEMIVGRHNFVCFRAPDPSRPDESTIVVVESAVIDQEEDSILFRISGSHFLWKMVRRLVGVLVKIGKGEVTTEAFRRLLDGKCDPALDVAAWTAPASGLFLETVEYPARRSRPGR